MLIEEMESFLYVQEHEKKAIEARIKVERFKLDEQTRDIDDLREINGLMSAIAVLAQEETKKIIEVLVTRVLQTVFDSSYSFVIEDTVSHNTPQTSFYVKINDHLFSLKDELGGGVVDIVSCSLRIVFWALQNPRSSPVIILDEPGRCISRDKIPYVCQMFKELSEELGLQFIIVSHESDLIEASDVAYKVKKIRDISTVEKVRK
jgi:ABC-type glutathione transport system ATPase component